MGRHSPQSEYLTRRWSASARVQTSGTAGEGTDTVATADQVKALVRTHAEGDDTKFYSVALQVAARAAHGGQGHFAQELRDLVDSLRKESPKHAVGPFLSGGPAGELAGLLSVSYPRARMADLVLQPDVRARLERVILEERQQDTLRAHGFKPLRRLLLIGPPGTGRLGYVSAEPRWPATSTCRSLSSGWMGLLRSSWVRRLPNFGFIDLAVQDTAGSTSSTRSMPSGVSVPERMTLGRFVAS